MASNSSHSSTTPDGVSISRIYEYYNSFALQEEDYFIHARLFKTPPYSDHLTIGEYSFTSSGTSGNPTTVHFNRQDSIEQQRNLLRILPSFLPIHRTNSVLICINVDKSQSNARLAASRGFSLLSKQVLYLPLDFDSILYHIELLLAQKKHIYLFSFTYDLYCLLQYLHTSKKSFSCDAHLSAIHGGGWKRHQSDAIDFSSFRSLFNQCFSHATLTNYYGMVEQLGNIYPSCEYDYHHTTPSNDIVIRNKYLDPCKDRENGIIQVISKFPSSQHNSSILTEDIGYIETQHCKCGRPGKAFRVLGRLENSQIRGCSNAYI